MKLEFKHITKYLPYEIGIEYGQLATQFLRFDTLHLIDLVLNRGWKMALRPFTDINKEIIFKGEKIKPLEIIGQDFIEDGFLEDGVFGWGQPTGGDDEQDYYLTIEKENDKLSLLVWCGEKSEGGYVTEQYELPYRYYEMLIGWHFDLDNLIDCGFAVSCS